MDKIETVIHDKKMLVPAIVMVGGGLVFVTVRSLKKPPAGQGAGTANPVAGTTAAADGSPGVIGYAGDSPPKVYQGAPGPAGKPGPIGKTGPPGKPGAPGKHPAGGGIKNPPGNPGTKPYHCPPGSVMAKELNGSGNDVCQRTDNGAQFQVIYNGQTPGQGGEGTAEWNHRDHYYGRKVGGFHPLPVIAR